MLGEAIESNTFKCGLGVCDCVCHCVCACVLVCLKVERVEGRNEDTGSLKWRYTLSVIWS